MLSTCSDHGFANQNDLAWVLGTSTRTSKHPGWLSIARSNRSYGGTLLTDTTVSTAMTEPTRMNEFHTFWYNFLESHQQGERPSSRA